MSWAIWFSHHGREASLLYDIYFGPTIQVQQEREITIWPEYPIIN